ncbi:hypothetical protein ACOM2C_03755 [Pseudarthrobacter sp. So.54]
MVAIPATTLAAVPRTATGDLGSPAEKVVLFLLFVFISTNTAVVVLRRDKVEHQHFPVPIIVPILRQKRLVLTASAPPGAAA